MALSDEIRKIQNPETNYDDLAHWWERALENVAAYCYYPDGSDEQYRCNAVAGPIGVLLDNKRRVNEVKVQGYNQRDLKRYNKLTNYNPGFVWSHWRGDNESKDYIPLGDLSKYTEHFVDENYYRDEKAGRHVEKKVGQVLDKYKFCLCKRELGQRASLFSEEEEATKVARIIKSCGDGGFKRYKVGVRRITGPVYVEEYVSNVIPGRLPGFFANGREEEYDVAFRTVGRQVKYAVEVDIAW